MGNRHKIPKRIVIVSLDAVGSKDLAFMSTLPHFKAYMSRAAICSNVSSVYPSITYPAHTSIITGKLPCHHGVVNNTLLQPRRENPDWMWQRKYVKGTTLYDEVLKKGWKVATLLWPVTAKSKITYNLPEIFANRAWQNQIMVSACNGSLRYQLELNHKFGNIRKGVTQPALDDFVQASALYTIDTYHPDMLLLHFTDVDTHRHLYGVNHLKVQDALRRHDKRLGELIAHLEKQGGIEETAIIVLGDHYQKNTAMAVYPNVLLKEKGLLTVKKNRIQDYQLLAKNCDGACYLYRNPKQEGENKNTPAEIRFLEKLTAVLEEIKTDARYGTKRIFTQEEAKKLGADDRCVAMLEAKDGYYYLDDVEELTKSVDDIKKGKMHATHGYFPLDDTYKTFFMALGCGIQENLKIPQMNLCDVGTTLAGLLDVDLGETDGKEIDIFTNPKA